MGDMLKRMIESLNEGDTIMVSDINRFADSPEEVTEVLDILDKKNVTLIENNK